MPRCTTDRGQRARCPEPPGGDRLEGREKAARTVWRPLARTLAWGVIAVPALVFTWGCLVETTSLSKSCDSDDDCILSTAVCSPNQVCVEGCRASGNDCSGNVPLCNTTGEAEYGQCVECVTAADCGPGEVCSQYGRCGMCIDNDGCLPNEICYLNACADATGDIAVNQTTESEQLRPAIAVDQFGEFVVVWEGIGEEGWGIFGQRVASSGSLVDDEIAVATSAVSVDPDVARDAFTARFVVVWREGLGSVVAQRFSATGAAVGGPIVVTEQGLLIHKPAVAMNFDGFIVVWARLEPGSDGWEIQGRRYTADGMPVGDEFEVNTTSNGTQDWPDVALDIENHFVVVWESVPQDGDGFGVYGQWFSEGAPVGGEIPVNFTTIGDQVKPAVAMDPENGRFVVAWAGEGPGDEENLFGQRFSFGGLPDGSEFPVNATPLGLLRPPSVSMAAGGSFAVTWDRWSTGSHGDIFLQRFQSDATPIGGETPVNAFTLSDQQRPVAALDRQDTVIGVAWESNAQDGSGSGVFGQFGPVPLEPAAATTSRDRSWSAVSGSLLVPAPPIPPPAAAGGGSPYGSWPDPTVTLLPAAPGGSSEHELAISIHPGELETYTATWGYPADFGFAGFTAIGPIGSAVGWYRLDTDSDGVPEVERPLVSLGDDTAYVDLDDDGDAIGNPMLVRGDGPGPQFYLVAPYGGDGNPSTLTVPVEARITVGLMSGILLNPAAPGTYTVLIRLTSVDPDTDDMDDGAGISPVTESGQIDVFLIASQQLVFADGFESGDTSAWTSTQREGVGAEQLGASRPIPPHGGGDRLGPHALEPTEAFAAGRGVAFGEGERRFIGAVQALPRVGRLPPSALEVVSEGLRGGLEAGRKHAGFPAPVGDLTQSPPIPTGQGHVVGLGGDRARGLALAVEPRGLAPGGGHGRQALRFAGPGRQLPGLFQGLPPAGIAAAQSRPGEDGQGEHPADGMDPGMCDGLGGILCRGAPVAPLETTARAQGQIEVHASIAVSLVGELE